MGTIHTIGHSTHPIDEFLQMLQSFGIGQLVDIRTVPGSRRNPQFGQREIAASLAAAGIAYIHMKGLGGLRKGDADSINLGWRNLSFRNYADYMQTEDFDQALEELIRLSQNPPTAMMCAEAVPWRCHRSLVSDALLVRGVTVLHIMAIGKANRHALTPIARVDGTRITYPAEMPSEQDER